MIIKIENSKQNVIQPMEKSRCWLYTTQLLRHIFSQSVSLTQYVVLCACPSVHLSVPVSFRVVARCRS